MATWSPAPSTTRPQASGTKRMSKPCQPQQATTPTTRPTSTPPPADTETHHTRRQCLEGHLQDVERPEGALRGMGRRSRRADTKERKERKSHPAQDTKAKATRAEAT